MTRTVPAPPETALPSRPVTTRLDRARLQRAKASYTTRHVDLDRATGLLAGVRPAVGDLVLAAVTSIGQHPKIEGQDGRRASLFPGDEVVVAYGHRYAPDQFEASVPDDLGPCDLVAAGGIAARVDNAHGKMQPPTTLAPVGLLTKADGSRLRLASGSTPRPATARPVTIAVVGAAMNAGKTTTAAHLVRGLRRAGLRVGAAKTTGTGAGGDIWLLGDAGAYPVYDFTWAGLPSTYRAGADEVRRVFTTLNDRLVEDGCEVVVLEIADGVYQEETSELVADPAFVERVDGVLFAACDALGAAAGVAWLYDHDRAPLALSGVLSSSPLATREAEAATGHEVWGLSHLEDPDLARELFDRLGSGRDARAAMPSADAPPAREQELASHTAPDVSWGRS